MLTSLCNIHQEKVKISFFFLRVQVFCRDCYLVNDRYSKLAFLHRVKEWKTPSLSTQASFAPFPEGGVVWKIPYLRINEKPSAVEEWVIMGRQSAN